jgi:hypothetical protein
MNLFNSSKNRITCSKIYKLIHFFFAFMLFVLKGFFLWKLAVVRAEFNGDINGLTL